MVTKINYITVTKNTLLACLDIECLYSNIKQNLDLKAVKHFLYTKSIQFLEHNNFVVLLLELLLTQLLSI